MTDPHPGADPRFGTAGASTFDARPLAEPVPRAAARAFAQELRRTGRLPGG